MAGGLGNLSKSSAQLIHCLYLDCVFIWVSSVELMEIDQALSKECEFLSREPNFLCCIASITP